VHSGIWGVGGYGQLRGGTKCGGQPFFRRNGRGLPLFSAREKENVDILGNLGHFGAQKARKCSKMARNNL
jgi:hypothetical protein